MLTLHGKYMVELRLELQTLNSELFLWDPKKLLANNHLKF